MNEVMRHDEEDLCAEYKAGIYGQTKISQTHSHPPVRKIDAFPGMQSLHPEANSPIMRHKQKYILEKNGYDIDYAREMVTQIHGPEASKKDEDEIIQRSIPTVGNRNVSVVADEMLNDINTQIENRPSEDPIVSEKIQDPELSSMNSKVPPFQLTLSGLNQNPEYSQQVSGRNISSRTPRSGTADSEPMKTPR